MNGSILLVEDHEDTANAFARMLRRDGYVVTIANSATDALALCAAHMFDLLICDLELPDGDGSQILKAARDSRPRTQGIVVSGHDDFGNRDKARAAGFLQCFVKPVDYVALRQTVAQVLARE